MASYRGPWCIFSETTYGNDNSYSMQSIMDKRRGESIVAEVTFDETCTLLNNGRILADTSTENSSTAPRRLAHEGDQHQALHIHTAERGQNG